ncbi:hypothetical protein ScPMuIL_016170 [Solemya velum]
MQIGRETKSTQVAVSIHEGLLSLMTSMVFVRKKTLLLTVSLAVVIFTIIQISHFNEAYSPLQVLSDARSEAKRLLRFLTLYHYQCNITLHGVNISDWPVCTESENGIDLESKLPRTALSVGPSGDFDLERVLAQNFSFEVYIFTHKNIESSQIVPNNTHIYRLNVVPNDPSDFSRVSYETNTINNLLQMLKLQNLAILKIDQVFDMSHSHELLYFLIKDHLLSDVKQLHITIRIDKVDDDYLYSWYRALYKLFHVEGFRLYHTSASDPLCLQVTLMESCIYYLSWIRNPGPRAFILYPPAMDGSQEFEIERLIDYLDNPSQICEVVLHVELKQSSLFPVCLDSIQMTGRGSCVIYVFREKSYLNVLNSVMDTKCTIKMMILSRQQQDGLEKIFVREIGLKSKGIPVSELFGPSYLQANNVNILYIDAPNMFWNVITPILDSGILWNVYQLLVDIKIWSSKSELLPLNIRSKYSELKRIEAYRFKLHSQESISIPNLKIHQDVLGSGECCYRLSYLKNKYKYRTR